jgi:CubicO group peptidase (beta-lactamase class C family)
MRLTLLYLCMALSTCLRTQAQRGINIEATVDTIINAEMKKGNIPGMAVAIVQNGNVLLEKGYGVRAVNGKEPVDKNTVFAIGSVSKALTAIGIMTLVQQNKIILDSPAVKYLPIIDKKWSMITVKEFMTHTSGIAEVKPGKGLQFQQALAKVEALPMKHTPGTVYEYNDFNYAVMGALLAQVAAQDYLPFMQAKVFNKASMKYTGVGVHSSDTATGYLEKNGVWYPRIYQWKPEDYGVSSGGLQSTINDFVGLSQALRKYDIINAATTAIMWTPFTSSIPVTPGWFLSMAGNNVVIDKNGFGTGIGCMCDFKIVPSKNIYVVIMMNKDLQGSATGPSGVTNQIIHKCFNLPFPKAGPNN